MAWLWIVPLVGLLGVGAYWTARHGLRQPAGLPRGLAAAVLAWAWVTVGMELLGGLGALYPLPLTGWSALAFAIGVALRRSDRARGTAADAGPLASWEPAEPSAALAVGLTLWLAAIFFTRSLWLPVKVISDGPIYHLYFAARWWKAGRLFLVAAPFGESAATYFPATGDLWLTWLIVGWGGDRLAKIGQAPFHVAAVLSVFGMARLLGAGRSSALIATAWFATVTPLVIFSAEPNVDSIFIAGYLLAAYFFLRHQLDGGGAAALSLGALAAGGALGSKAIGIVFVPPLLALEAAAILRGGGSPGRRGRDLGLLLGLPMVMAGLWYVRNAWLTGNPLYPLHVEGFGRVWLAGWYDRRAMRFSPYYIPVGYWGAFADTLLAVTDPRQTLVWLAALVGAWRLGRGRDPLARWVWLVSALAVANVALYWFLIPYRTQQRFMFHALGLAAVPLALTFDRGPRLRWAATLLLAMHVLTHQGWPLVGSGPPPSWDLAPEVPSFTPPPLRFSLGNGQPAQPGEDLRIQLYGPSMLAIGLASLGAAWLWCRPDRRRPRVRAALGGLLALVAWAGASVLVVPGRADARHLFYPVFADYYIGWLQLDSRSGRAGTRVAYAGTDLPYYLLGVGLRNEVRYENVDGHRDWLMHDYHREARARGWPPWPDPRPGWDRASPDYDAWLANLRADRIRLLVVTRANPSEGRHNIADIEGFPIERGWAESHPDDFEPAYGVAPPDPRFRIYRLKPPPRPRSAPLRPEG